MQDVIRKTLKEILVDISDRRKIDMKSTIRMVRKTREILAFTSFRDAAVFVFEASWHPRSGWAHRRDDEVQELKEE